MFNILDYYEHGYVVFESHGVTATMQLDGSVITNGTAVDTSAIFNYDIAASHLPSGNYYASVGAYDAAINAPYAWNNTLSGRLKKWDGTTNMSYDTDGRFAQVKLPDDYIPLDIKFPLRCIKGKTTNNDHFYPQIINSIENPDNTVWEPYHGQTYSINWTSELGTIYGGYVDLISGELVQTKYAINPLDCSI